MRDRTTEIRLANALVESADTLCDDFETRRHLCRVADHCVELLDATVAGVMFTEPGDTVGLAPGSRQQGVVQALLTVQTEGGPCVESFSSGDPVPPVPLDTAEAASRWPAFTALARGHGLGATYAVPLRVRERTFGVLNAFTPAQRPHAGGELALAQALADAAAVGLLNHRTYAEYRMLSEQLQTALTSRIRIEQAKGVLAERWNTTVDEAFAALRRYARRERQVIDEVAAGVIKGSLDNDALRGDRPAPS